MVPPSAILGTFTRTLTMFEHDLGIEHWNFLSKSAANLFLSKQVLTKLIFDKVLSLHSRTLLLSRLLKV